MKKKALSLALALVMCLGLTIPAFAAEPKSITLEKFGIVVTMDGYLRTERYKLEGGTVTVYVVEDGSTVEYRAMEGFQYVTDEELLNHTGAFYDYVEAYGNGIGSGYAWFSGHGSAQIYPLTGPSTQTVDPILPGENRAYGLLNYYYCMYVCESDLARATRNLERIPDQPEAPVMAVEDISTATPTNDKLTVNGQLQNPTVYKINGNNYFKIRDLAAVLNGTEKQFDVGYDGALKSVTATTGKGYAKLDTDLAGAATGGSQTADPSNDTIYIDGQKVDATVYKINGNNYFKLRDLGKALNFYVGWTQADGVFIDTSKPYSE